MPGLRALGTAAGAWYARRMPTSWCIGRRFIPVLALVFVAVFAAVEVGIVGFAYERLGLGRYWVYAALTAPILGSRVNLPVAGTRAEIEECSGSGRCRIRIRERSAPSLAPTC